MKTIHNHCAAEKEKPVRIQFDLSTKMAKELEQFEAEGEMTTHREFFANAIALWRWAAQKSREGKTIASLEISNDQARYTELALPALDVIRRDALSEKVLTDSSTPAIASND